MSKYRGSGCFILIIGIMCVVNISRAEQQVDIGSELGVWTNEGQSLSRISHCDIKIETNQDNIFYYAPTECISNQLTAYILLNECASQQYGKRVTILDSKIGRATKAFSIDANSCANFEKHLPEQTPPNEYKPETKAYSIQFFAGKNEPKLDVPCVDIPLFVLNENNKYYLLSQYFPSRNEARLVLDGLQKKCHKKIDAWIRAVYIN